MPSNMLQLRRQSAAAQPAQRPANQPSPGPAPQAPRAMTQRGAPAQEVQLERLRQEEAEKLYPRLVPYAALASFKDKSQQRKESGDPQCEARRNFLDSFAYLCDTRKGGPTVTAAALQKLPLSNFLWLAANEGISDDVLRYAKDVLAKLKTATMENQSELKDHIFQLVVEKCTARIQFYKNQVLRFALNCRMQLRHKKSDENVKTLRSKLKKLSEPGTNFTTKAYIDLCYEMRAVDIDHIKQHVGDDFSSLAHYIWRMGATRASANSVVESMLTVPSLHHISQIRRVSTPQTAEKSINLKFSSPYEILHDIVKDFASRNPLQLTQAFARLVKLDPPENRLFSQATSTRKIVTHVHAELQIADTFSRSRDMDFVDNDRYIGCSKAACYFCYNWLLSHKHKYVLPATRYKIILRCRGLDEALNETGAGVVADMYAKVAKRIGQDVLEFLSRREGRTRRQYMSTEASSVAASSIGYV